VGAFGWPGSCGIYYPAHPICEVIRHGFGPFSRESLFPGFFRSSVDHVRGESCRLVDLLSCDFSGLAPDGFARFAQIGILNFCTGKRSGYAGANRQTDGAQGQRLGSE
jgi:hypothetical protein